MLWWSLVLDFLFKSVLEHCAPLPCYNWKLWVHVDRFRKFTTCPHSNSIFNFKNHLNQIRYNVSWSVDSLWKVFSKFHRPNEKFTWGQIANFLLTQCPTTSAISCVVLGFRTILLWPRTVFNQSLQMRKHN